LLRALVAEAIGTFALVFAGCGAIVVDARTQQLGHLGVALTFGLVIMVGIYAVGHISGAHFNPAVTAVMTLLRQISVVDAAIYIVAQLGGAVAGALITKLLLEDEGKGVNYGAVAVSSRLNGDILPGMAVEALGTFFLVWVIVGVAVNPRATKDWAALAIGAALGMAVMVFAPLTGAGFNPARAFGPAIVSGEWGGTDTFLLVYVLAPVIGALVAGFLYFVLVIAPGKRGVGGVEPVG
jgi:MIP family channel proteins